MNSRLINTIPRLMSLLLTYFTEVNVHNGRSQWPHGLRRRSAAARLLKSWVRIPPGMDVCLL